MNKILVVDDEEGIRDVILMVLETHFEYEILEAVSGNQAIEILKDEPHIGLVLCDYRMDDGNGGEVYRYVHENSSHIPFVLVSTNEPGDYEVFHNYKNHNVGNGHIVKPFSSDILIQTVKSSFIQDYSLEDSKNIISNTEVTFFKVRAKRFEKYSGDYSVFIRLSEDKFVKIRESGDDSKGVIQKYLDKDIPYFYLRDEDYNKFFGHVMHNIFMQLGDVETSPDDIDELQLESIEQIHDFLKSLGVNEKTIEAIDEVVKTTITVFKKNKRIPNLLNSFDKMEGYIYKHSYLTSYIACAIADKMNWKSAGVWEKLVFSSLFQNIAIDDPDLAKFFSITGDDFCSLELKERNQVKGHISQAISMLEKIPEFSGESRSAIMNHHEQPDGTGFPRGLDSRQIGPMDALFVISLNFAHEIIVGCRDNEEKVTRLAQSYEGRYDKGNYKQAYEALIKVFG